VLNPLDVDEPAAAEGALEGARVVMVNVCGCEYVAVVLETAVTRAEDGAILFAIAFRFVVKLPLEMLVCSRLWVILAAWEVEVYELPSPRTTVTLYWTEKLLPARTTSDPALM
jgi:hypothetical protein